MELGHASVYSAQANWPNYLEGLEVVTMRDWRWLPWGNVGCYLEGIGGCYLEGLEVVPGTHAGQEQ